MTNPFKRKPRQNPLVMLHLEGFDKSPEGYLVGIELEHYILKNAKVQIDGHTSVPIDGTDLAVPRKRVIFVQVLSGSFSGR